MYVCMYVWRIAQCSSTDFLKYRIPSVSKRETKIKLCASPHPMINFNNAFINMNLVSVSALEEMMVFISRGRKLAKLHLRSCFKNKRMNYKLISIQ